MRRTLLLLLTPLALADDQSCPPVTGELEGPALLRAASLDLRGTIPTYEELQRLDDGEAYEELVTEWLDTESFADQVVRIHRDILWPNVTDIRLMSNRQRLIEEDGLYYRYLSAPNLRGGPIHCGDFEAEFDDDGELVFQEDDDGNLQEGWVAVHPYWAPDETIKVCAIDAQDESVSPLGTACNEYDNRYDLYCGCGPELAWCDTPELGHNGDNPEPPVHMAIARDAELRVKRVIEQDLSYLELLTGNTAFVNGPLVHFYTYQLSLPAHVRFNEVPVDPELLPELVFTEADTWVEVELGPEQSGILTSPLYLMKFQTRRARANRFYSAFLCQPFQPPAGGLTELDDDNPPLDLTIREGCKYCHAILEPAGAHWGRWSEYGAGWLDPDEFPTYDEDCHWCASTGESCSSACSNYYVVDPLTSEEDPFVGWLQSYEFLEERHHDNAEQGPELLVSQGVLDGRLPDCVAQTAAEWLMGREMTDDDQPWVDELSASFSASQFDYKTLVSEIVTSEPYRSVK